MLHVLNDEATLCRHVARRSLPGHTKPLKPQPPLQCFADAVGEGHILGIGGWMATTDTTEGHCWFSEQWDKEPQRYIACWETLAQSALLQLGLHFNGALHQTFCMPSGSNNTAAEAGCNKIFTTSWPLSHFLRVVASWSYACNVSQMVSHVPGTKNDWADELSSNKLARFLQKPELRLHFTLASLAHCGNCVTPHPPTAKWDERFLAWPLIRKR